MYKYLIFDLDDTLLDFKKSEDTAIREVFAEFGVSPTDENVSLYSGINKSFWERFERGEIKREDIFEGRFIEFSKALGISLPADRVSAEYFNRLSLCGFVLAGAKELLEALFKNYTLVAATNGHLPIQKSRIALSGLSKYFNGGIYISGALNTQKPEKKFFDIILNDLKNPNKDEVLVLGDSLSSDILGAKNAGLDSCYVDLKNKGGGKGLYTYTVTALCDIPKVCNLKQ